MTFIQLRISFKTLLHIATSFTKSIKILKCTVFAMLLFPTLYSLLYIYKYIPQFSTIYSLSSHKSIPLSIKIFKLAKHFCLRFTNCLENWIGLCCGRFPSSVHCLYLQCQKGTMRWRPLLEFIDILPAPVICSHWFLWTSWVSFTLKRDRIHINQRMRTNLIP